MPKLLLLIGRIFLYSFALIGFTTTAVFFAMQFDLLNVPGSIDTRNSFFEQAHREFLAHTTPPLATSSPTLESDDKTGETRTDPAPMPCTTSETSCAWNTTPEWEVVQSGLFKDAEVIMRVSNETGVSARMIASVVVPEQIRFFTSNREVFKRWFEPMKLLGSLSQFSLGVSGIKQETAVRIEAHAWDTQSPFYPGDGFTTLIAHEPNANIPATIFTRLTNEDDHYYSYLYTALFIKEIQEQWRRAGYDITQNPGIVVTLFNLGFDHSIPKSDPQVGGAPITVGNTTYTYGSLGALFYNSEELGGVFPR